MTVTIEQDFGDGASGLSDETGGATVADALRAAADDMTNLRVKFAALLAKLDADTGLDDSDYVSTLTPAAQTLVKG